MLTNALSGAGGLALFLLAMAMMTDGLKVFGGRNLKALLKNWTGTTIRGVLSGALVTATVQSSSAVTVATIGFVNAGVLSLRQALTVIFGANVGTTITGWLVAVVGFGFRIEAFALPIIAIGVGLRLLMPTARQRGLGDAITGFGLFFLGLAFLKEGFAGVAANFGIDAFGSPGGPLGTLAYVAVGFVATVLTQSSSAAIALILTAVSEGVIGPEIGAAAIIGANVGTTSTAVIAVIAATPNAKRVAAGHLAFNLATGIIALALLPGLLAVITWIGGFAGMTGHPVPLLALFHTVFNFLGVVLLSPFAGRMSRLLDRFFRSAEEDMSRPQHLDQTVLAAPELAIGALHQELGRLQSIVRALARASLGRSGPKPAAVARRSEAITSLGEAITEFAASIRTENLSRAVAEELPRALRVARYLEEAARLAPLVEDLARQTESLDYLPARLPVRNALDAALRVIGRPDEDPADGSADVAVREEATEAARDVDKDLADFETRYQEAKAAALAAVAGHGLGISKVGVLLDGLSHLRRLVEQIAKAGASFRLGLGDGSPADVGGNGNGNGETEADPPRTVPDERGASAGTPPTAGRTGGEG
ncbi:Na/Pi cotransporter family protein [Oceanibacterium hippocampi]|uniref:Na+/Pi-cotransporter n=1 Tax=Oceanibacterium hippocampi TaxID=745714 RepID=A0A1Y5SBS1_9PROT|nr:Na/Pi cotransporter family protein [Oceanibacterium hippocampi]SLN35582.1 Na+/Pi-cotransporter [Oceanibacterium hippocampi]